MPSIGTSIPGPRGLRRRSCPSIINYTYTFEEFKVFQRHRSKVATRPNYGGLDTSNKATVRVSLECL